MVRLLADVRGCHENILVRFPDPRRQGYEDTIALGLAFGEGEERRGLRHCLIYYASSGGVKSTLFGLQPQFCQNFLNRCVCRRVDPFILVAVTSEKLIEFG